MTELHLSIGEPFTSPAWGSNFVLFSGEDAIGEDSAKEYLRKACKYAKTYGVYLVPQRFILMEYQCMCLISPEGKVLGAQKALHVNPLSRVGKRSSSIEVLRSEFGGIFLCVDVDIYHPEVARIAAGMGAQIIVCSQRLAGGDYNSSMVFTGVWNAAQSGIAYVVAACNEFNCVCAPLKLTRHGDGFLCAPSRKLPLTAKLQTDALSKCKQPFRLSRKFYAVHRGDLIR